ncbi:DUF485 domain-containing protein [Lichenibacterium minor]|uniref:DUF485 domain-containing protein n=1 Tax=Lichenibacterium minor TaxID=2316528 RepID=A0A4Q2U4N0_9HYPH|nr:DUF485 domain-containing protein [Lichenibacterium minor]RYC31519.1 DUF485 domain-containing protein [Lichenibacterium minor]
MLDKQSAATIDDTDRIMRDPAFQALVKERTSFGWTMSIAMLVVYLAFIFLAAFGKGFMASTIAGSFISWGIVFGVFTIVFAFALTGIYVSRANGRFDDLTAQLNRDAM